jgi:hypothetical protein
MCEELGISTGESSGVWRSYESQVNYGTGETLPVTKREVVFPWNRMFEVDVKAQ